MPERGREIVLVTGASGFLGRHVARQFAAEGAFVAGLGHGPFGGGSPADWGLSEWRAGDVTMATLMALPKPDIIAHCAGGSLVGRSFEAPREDFERTVATTAEVLDYIRLVAPGARLVYPSSAAVYGNATILPIPTRATGRPLSPYGTHKRSAEELCRSYALNFGVRCAILRFFSIYGRHLRKQLLWDACNKLASGSGAFSGTGRELRDWLHVDDAAALFVTAARFASPACPIANGGTGIGTSVGDVLNRLGAGLAPEIAIRFTGAQRQGDPSAFVADIAEAAAWNWRPTIDWADGVDDYSAWYREASGRPRRGAQGDRAAQGIQGAQAAQGGRGAQHSG